MYTPKISVILPVYNVEPYLPRCLDSILKQNFDSFEVLAVVRPSQDKSCQIIDEYAYHYPKIRIINEDVAGLGKARNRGLDEALGQYVMFIDSDDYIRQGMFRSMIRLAEENELDILCCGVKRDCGESDTESMENYAKFSNMIFDMSDSRKEILYNFAVGGRTITAWAKLYSYDFINKFHLRFDLCKYYEDWIFNVRTLPLAQRVGSMERAFYIYVDRPGSIVYNIDVEQLTNSISILWNEYQIYDSEIADRVRAFAAVRMSSSILLNLKRGGLTIDHSCRVAYDLINELGMKKCLIVANDDDWFTEYSKMTNMPMEYALNYHQFIKSLNSFEHMLEWQKKYAEVENRGVKR